MMCVFESRGRNDELSIRREIYLLRSLFNKRKVGRYTPFYYYIYWPDDSFIALDRKTVEVARQ